jgi:hexokinase
LYEKLVSGQYVGEIVRRELVRLREARRAFQVRGAMFERGFGVDARWLSRVAADASPALDDVERALRQEGARSLDVLERKLLQWLVHAVVERSARMVAVGILGALRAVDPEDQRPHEVAIDGSLYGGFPGYDRMLEAALEELGGEGTAGRVGRTFVKDSTSAGAAVIAAVARTRMR